MFAMRPRHRTQPFAHNAQIPTGMGARHVAEGVLEILPEMEAGLTDCTPILDLKPYLSSMPAVELKRGGKTEAERKASSGDTA